jgi:hypothetical protein
MENKGTSNNNSGVSSDHQSGPAGNNETHGHSKPSTPGMTPGIEQQAENARREDEAENASGKNEQEGTNTTK